MSHLCCETLWKWNVIFSMKQISLTATCSHSKAPSQRLRHTGTQTAPLEPKRGERSLPLGCRLQLCKSKGALEEQRGAPSPSKLASILACVCFPALNRCTLCSLRVSVPGTEHGTWQGSATGMFFCFCCRGVGKAGERGL